MVYPKININVLYFNFNVTKIKQIIIVVLWGLIAIYIINTIYSVLKISAFNPSNKKYKFTFSASGLLKKINYPAENDINLIFKLKDTTDSFETGNRNYEDIYLKHGTTSYTFSNVIKELDKEHSKMGLVGAFDNTHNFGGYQNNDKEMQSLINIFIDKFVAKINYTQ